MPGHSYNRQIYVVDAGPLGYLEGVSIEQSNKPLCYYFGGVPYALPPIGPYRFRQARPLPDFFRYGTKKNPGRYTGACSVCPQPNAKGQTSEDFWSEDVLQSNIYIPSGIPPGGGWPVFFYIHGGFLQWGTPNYTAESMVEMICKTGCIVVSPAYRLNALGFLASKELEHEARTFGEHCGNCGFWDQRLALEWTSKNIQFLGGNGDNITVGGYSAGAHSAYQQLAHELYFAQNAIIRRVIMWSNSPGVQPKDLTEHQKGFDELMVMLKISPALSSQEKLQKLRDISHAELVAVQDRMLYSEFRALSDGVFIPKDVIAKINSGDFARRMKARGIKLMNGECRDEHYAYREWRTPADSYEALYTRLRADYPEQKVRALLRYYCGAAKGLPAGMKDWQEAFGRIYANMQVHCLERGFHNALVRGGLRPEDGELLRYRFDWQTKSSAETTPHVTHATDLGIWFMFALTEDEQEILQPWHDAFTAFVKGEEVQWRTKNVQEMTRLTKAGKTDVWKDDRWDEGLRVWKIVNGDELAVLNWLRSKL